METVKIILDGAEVEIPKADLEWFKEGHGVDVVGEPKKKSRETTQENQENISKKTNKT